MKRFISACLSVVLIILICCTMNVKAVAVSTSAGASVLYCVNNNTVIYKNNSDTKMKMASTTKLMTTLLALEYGEKDNKAVTFKSSMIEEGSSMYLKVGEQLHLKDLSVGMMLPSGNDAATASAVAISGSKEKFANLMNKRAKQIGMKNSHFVTPSGLDDDNHYTTAYDMALLMAECLKNKDFREISGSSEKTVSFIKPKGKAVTYHNHNRLLKDYPYCISGKTGYTEAAGRCLVTAAKKNGITLIAVTLNDKNDWNDHKALYNYGFSLLKGKLFKGKTISQNVVGGTDNNVKIKIPERTFVQKTGDKKITRKILLEPFVYAPVNKGDRAGMVYYIQNGKIIDKQSLRYTKAVEYKSCNTGFFHFISELFK